MEAFEQLEVDFSAWSGAENPVACSSGSSALHLAFEALQLPPGSEVLCPQFTMVACARAIVMAGLKPVFVDCGDDLNIDPSLFADALRAETAAILVVHIYGRQCNMSRIADYARLHGLAVVEDLAEAHGVAPHYKTDAACWSFYANKIIKGEEGGLVAFRNPEHAAPAKLLRCQGFTAEHDFMHVPRGCNYRLSNANAELILNSLARANENLMKRKWVERWYNECIPAEYHMPPRDVVWVYDLRAPGMKTTKQNQVVKQLNAQGVAARHAFKSMCQQPEFAGPYEHLNAYRLSQEVIYLPVHPAMTRAHVQVNVRLFLEALRNA